MLLSQKFVQLFLATQGEGVVSLDDAAKTLLGGAADISKLKTKVRRLYDIANILTSLNLIEKTQLVDKKPAFKWLGITSGKSTQYNFNKRASPEPRESSFNKRIKVRNSVLTCRVPLTSNEDPLIAGRALSPVCALRRPS